MAGGFTKEKFTLVRQVPLPWLKKSCPNTYPKSWRQDTGPFRPAIWRTSLSSCCENYLMAVIINQLETAQVQRTMSWHWVHIYSVRESNEKKEFPSRAETPIWDTQEQNESAVSVEDVIGLLQNWCPTMTKTAQCCWAVLHSYLQQTLSLAGF